jgi:ferric-dicitrate binding protein FerR (iron transport regulator)
VVLAEILKGVQRYAFGELYLADKASANQKILDGIQPL